MTKDERMKIFSDAGEIVKKQVRQQNDPPRRKTLKQFIR